MTLRTGITTGTCAAAAAKAAAMVLTGQPAPADVEITLPAGDVIHVPVLYARVDSDGRQAIAAVRKDAGDDPDVTGGLEIVATVWHSEEDAMGGTGGLPASNGLCATGGLSASVAPGGIRFLAGEGVGTVTRPGLQIPPGQPAINPVPRRMIESAIRQVTAAVLAVEIAIPGGRDIAAQTFNPRLGVVGGLSILGTTGIVRPYCTKALHDALRCALDVAAACGVAAPVLAPGNIGATAAGRHFAIREEQLIEVGNEWGFVLDELAGRAFRAVLLVGHPGKLAKLAAGDWDTHSARSASATGFVSDLFVQVLARPAPASPTVEGIFAALSEPERSVLGDALAERIAAAVSARVGNGNDAQPSACRFAKAVAVLLVNMSGDRLGVSGDLSPWQ